MAIKITSYEEKNVLREYPNIPYPSENELSSAYPYGVIIKCVVGEEIWYMLNTHHDKSYILEADGKVVLFCDTAGEVQYKLTNGTWTKYDTNDHDKPCSYLSSTQELIWSSHDIKTATGTLNGSGTVGTFTTTDEIRFAKSGESTTSMVDTSIIFPDVPTDVLTEYPYATVLTAKDDEAGIVGVLIVSKSEQIVQTADDIPHIATDSQWKGYMFIPSYYTSWTEIGEDENLPSGEIPVDGVIGYTLSWSNHDIRNADTNEIYFAATAFTARFELDYTKFVYGGLDESVVTAPQFDIIDDEYPYAVMIKFTGFVYLYTTHEPLRAYTSSSNYTYLYHSDDARSYKLSINLGGVWFYDNTVNEDNDDYIGILFEDKTMIWSNYDILAVDTDKVETGETYFAKSGDISSEDVHELDIRIFPNVPTEWMDVYPYLCAVKLVMNGMTIYAALLSDKNMSAIPIGILDPSMGVVVSNTVSSASYIYVEDTDKWDDYSANINTARDISWLGHGVLLETLDVIGSIGWSNHNITTYAYDETIDDLVETDDIYFSGSGVVEPPEKMVVNRSFIVAMSGNTRRLTNTLDKMNTDEMTEILSDKQFNLQTKTVTPTTEQQVITADNDWYGLGSITVEAVPAVEELEDLEGVLF